MSRGDRTEPLQARGWSYVVDFPDDGWVWAPEPGDDVARWAQEICAEVGAAGEVEVQLNEQLRSFGLSYRSRGHEAGALWVPSARYGVLATLVTDTISADRGDPVTLDEVEAHERTLDDPELAPSVITRVTLPAGPAVRARRMETVGNHGHVRVTELVSHVVVPADLRTAEGSPAGVRLVVSWQLLADGDDLAALADQCAGLLRIERQAPSD